MLRRSITRVSRAQCRHRYTTTTAPRPRPIPILPDASLETFRRDALEASRPALFPRKHFRHLPAVTNWFNHNAEHALLNATYLSPFGATVVPLEITNNGQFVRIEQSLSFFLDASTIAAPTARVYLAQASITNFPTALRADVPTPDVVLHAGKGDVYDTSIWIGQAPTYTPLHRDPNPNVFVQLAGKKMVRIFEPQVGRGIFAKVQEQIGSNASATMRGEEMMQGEEKEALEKEVWQSDGAHIGDCFETELHSGDGLFIPKGYWHSIRSDGDGMVGSVNWWFR